MHRLPLAAVRVLDLGMAGAGAYCARILGDMGAEVIEVEYEGGQGRSPRFNQMNRNKLGCALELFHPHGRDLLLRLAAKSDVVIESFDDGERLGLTYEALRVARADIIVASVAGRPEGKLPQSSISLDDVIAGTAAAGAVCAALLYHRRSGEGQHIEVEARDCAISFLGEFVVARSMGHSPPPQTPIPLLSPHDLLSDPHLRQRRFFEPVSHPEGDVEEIAGLPWRFSRTPGHVRLPAPLPGQHNSYVFGVLLGLSSQEMAKLERAGVIGTTVNSERP